MATSLPQPRDLAEPELSRLRRGLELAVRSRGWSYRHVSRLLKRYPEYMGRMLSGKTEVKVSETYRILELLELEPYTFFETYFPLGGAVVVATEKLKEAVAAPERLLMERFAAQGLSNLSAGLDARAWAARASSLLRLKVRQAGRTQSDLAATLGLTPSGFGQRLRGGSRLLWWQVFAVLRLLGIDPSRYFYELFFPDRSLGASLALGQILDAWEVGQQALASKALELQALEEKRSEAVPEDATAEPKRDG